MKIIIAEGILPEERSLSLRAVRWIEDRPAQKDAIICYGDNAVCFYVKRNRASISVRKISNERA